MSEQIRRRVEWRLRVRRALPALIVALTGAHASAQFTGTDADTDFVERITGQVVSSEGEPTPESGDQVAVLFGESVVGLFTFSSQQDDPREFDVIIFGDDPDTTPVEGPQTGQSVQFQFFDLSTNMVRTDVAPINSANEVVNLTFQGDFVFTLPINVPGAPPFPGAPAREFNLLLGADAPAPNDGGGNGGGGGGGAAAPNPDVDGDGRVTRRDAAIVLRIIAGAQRAVPEGALARADVNGDGVISARDAIAILRPQSLRVPTPLTRQAGGGGQ